MYNVGREEHTEVLLFSVSTSQILDSQSVILPGMESGKVVCDLRQGIMSGAVLHTNLLQSKCAAWDHRA